MKISGLFFKTQKEIPKEAKIPSHQLLLKGGFIYQTASGSFSLLPLGFLVFQKIENIIREELKKVGCQEILMPVVQPALLWKESGRYFTTGPELLRAKGRDEEFVLAMTNEEVVTDLVKNMVRSWQDLSFILNQFQTKFRDEPRPRGGLLRLREFVMQDAYSFDKDEKGLDESYKKMVLAYQNIFKKLDLPTLKVQASSGIMGGQTSEEFMVLSDYGEDEIVICQKCDYKANIECASSIAERPKTRAKFKELKEVDTPKMTTVSQVADYLRIEPSSVIKSMVYRTNGKLILVLIRGDLEINQNKLQGVLAGMFEPATESDFKKHNIVPGFVGPIGLKNIPIYADYSLKLGGPYVTGANKIDTHLTGVNLGDFKIDKWIDIATVKEGDNCQKCGGKLSIKKAIELAHTFKLGTKYSESMKAYFMDKDGKRKPILMGCYGIGLERLLAAIVETHRDENGIIWPKNVAPFSAYLMDIVITSKDKKLVGHIYNRLKTNGIEVLYDDRDKTAGYKFAEADLIGCPYRLTISRRSLNKNCIEVRERGKKESKLVEIDKIVDEVKKLLR
jgi:prolyl-tRNA synthetase